MIKKFLLVIIVLIIGFNLVKANEALIGGEFELVDTHNQKITEQDLLGKYSLIYFGYTTCPKICPQALNNLSLSYNDLPTSKSKNLNIYFVTIDPRIDDITQVKNFMSTFDSRIIGLTGTKDQITKAQQSYRVFSQVTDQKDENGNILINHSSFIYLMSPKGKYITHFPHDISAQEMAKSLNKIIK